MEITAKEANLRITDTIAAAFSTFEQAEAAAQYHSDECTDLEHALEFLPDNHPQRKGLDERLTVARRKRRRAKETVEQYEQLIELLRRHKNFAKELSQILQTINITLGKQAKRSYRMRVLKDFGESLNYRMSNNAVSASAFTSVRRDRRVRSGVSL
ncbi:hypothetical protein [Paenibacillus graminis]|uniref:hypothetical protein n=1 Tax=Paenibacillus graminis TaxID=189425 RepID=UPI002DB7160F|nr:hypothetical protein [Paenibacillus graminis]MEC0171151.1 hypothetical protein [Paenibacillus graminis]